MTDIAAAMGLAQLRKADRMRQRRAEIAARYSEAFRSVDELEVPSERADCSHAWHLYTLRLHLDRLQVDRARFIDELRRQNIGASVHFIPLHVHPYYRDEFGYKPEDYPVAYREYLREVSLPIYSRMDERDVQDVIDAVTAIVRKFR